ncbi:MAG TPA: glycosyltransferase family 4 protein [Candidatus Scalindua sp.]|nr:glycosyltransferase family 4 protein [Candidatus Scalindua sp.]|tara:strand:- start:652 stop:1677 length:1026 start_codon:yes stop_codon:yes gene_type:complete
MKILFLVQGLDVAASRYRVLQYLPYLKEHGIQASVQCFPKGFFAKLKVFKSVNQYDILFIQRKRFPVLWLKFIRKNARKIVYDFDDSVMYRSSKYVSNESKTRAKVFKNMVNTSDHVIAGNEYLQQNTTPYTQDVTIIPSPIDMTSYPQKKYPEKNDIITLGWIGAHGSIHYLKKMKPIFDTLAKRNDKLRLRIICDTFFDCENMIVEKKQWNEKDEVADIQSFDIGLMPLMDDPWSHGKCGLKVLQCLATGVPVVCSPAGINREIVENSVHGFWANTDEEWIEKLEILINDHELRKKMGVAGRERVIERYSLKANAPRMLKIFQQLVQNGTDNYSKKNTG